MRRKIEDAHLVKKYCSLKDSATKRNIPFNLSLKKLRSLLSTTTCYYTGLKFVEGDHLLGRSIDRVDSKGGYTDSNVVACQIAINRVKNDSDLKTLLLVCKGIVRFEKNKKQKQKK